MGVDLPFEKGEKLTLELRTNRPSPPGLPTANGRWKTVRFPPGH